MTILVSDLGDTVINKFKHGTYRLADFTVLPQKGVWRAIVDRHPAVLNWLAQRKQEKEKKRRLEEGFQPGPGPEASQQPFTIEQLAEDKPSHDELAHRLAKKIRETANDLKSGHYKRYSYEEWVEFTGLIRFTASRSNLEDPEMEGLIEWDWIGENSPMMSRHSEPEFVLDRLCESMQRYIRRSAGAIQILKPRPGERLDEYDVGSNRQTAKARATRQSDEIDPFDTGSKVHP
jgi:potassium channel subfamily K